MDSRKTSKGFNHINHSKPKTRREFIAQGLIGYAGLSLLPTNFGWQKFSAYGQDSSCGSSGGNFIPYCAFDMAGGAALPANFLVGNQGGPDDLLVSYDRLGWDPRVDLINRDFGLPMAADLSGLLAGILEQAPATARQNLRLGSFCHAAENDTSSNPLSAVSLISKAGNSGVFIETGLGIINSRSGGNSDVALKDPILKPLFVTNVEDVVGAINFGGQSLADLSLQSKTHIAGTALALSREQWQERLDLPGGDQLKHMAECAYSKNVDLVSNAGGVDPRLDQIFNNIYGIDPTTPANDQNAVIATLIMNSLRGYSGPGVYTLGGCDYHDGTSTTGDGKDLDMGREIGRAIRAAEALGVPFFFQLLTDGGCDNRVGSRIWNGDADGKCMTVIGFYSPNGAPNYVMKNNQPQIQVGHYTDGQGAERSTHIGSQPLRVACAVLANYLQIHDRLGDFQQIVGDLWQPTSAELDSLLIFDGTVSA